MSEELVLEKVNISPQTLNTLTTYNFIGSHDTIELTPYKEFFVQFKNILNQQAGIDVRSSSGVGQYATPSIRGSQGQQVLVFENSIPVNDLNGSSADIGLIGLNGASKIEIYRSFIPMELSPTAIGGAINVITDISKDNKGALKQTIGTYGVTQTSLNQSLTYKKLSLSFGLENNYAKNDFIYEELQPVSSPSTPQFEARYNNATSLKQQYLSTKYKISTTQSFDLKLKTFQSNRELSGEINTDENTANISNDKISLQAIHAYTFSNKSIIRSQFSKSNTEELYDDRGNSIGLDSQYNQYATNFHKWNINYTLPLKSVTLIINQQYQNEKLDVEYLNDENSSTSSCYINGNCDREYTRQQFNTGSRLEWILSNKLSWNNQAVYISTQDDPFSEENASNKSQYWSFHSGVNLEVHPGTDLYTSFNRQYRPASTSEIFGDKGSSVGNPDLIAEESESIEFGFNFHNLKSEIKSAFYLRDVKNNITAQQDSRGVIKYDNIGEVQYIGAELSADYSFSNIFKYSTKINYQKSEITKHSTSSYIGNELNDHRSWFLEQSLRASYLSYSATIQWSYEKGGYYDTLNYIERDKKSVVNALLSYKLKDYTFGFSAYNLTNNKTRTYFYTPVAGRTFYLTFKKNWNI